MVMRESSHHITSRSHLIITKVFGSTGSNQTLYDGEMIHSSSPMQCGVAIARTSVPISTIIIMFPSELKQRELKRKCSRIVVRVWFRES